MRARYRSLLLAVTVAALAGCGSPIKDTPINPLEPETTAETTGGTGAWLDAPGKGQFYNFFVDDGKEVTVDLYWYGTELVNGYREVQHTEKFASLAYGEHTEVITSRYFATPDTPADEALYIAVPAGSQVASAGEKVLGDDEPYYKGDLYDFNSDTVIAYLNAGKTAVVFLSPHTMGTTKAQPRVQSFYADLYPGGRVNFPTPEAEIPKPAAGEVVLPVGRLFGTDVRASGGKLGDLREWNWSANGKCLIEDFGDEGVHSYGGDGGDWIWAVPQNAGISIHPEFHTDRVEIDCGNRQWQQPVSISGIARPFALIVPTASGDPKVVIIDIP